MGIILCVNELSNKYKQIGDNDSVSCFILLLLIGVDLVLEIVYAFFSARFLCKVHFTAFYFFRPDKIQYKYNRNIDVEFSIIKNDCHLNQIACLHLQRPTSTQQKMEAETKESHLRYSTTTSSFTNHIYIYSKFHNRNRTQISRKNK